jgi:hypothetical protein
MPVPIVAGAAAFAGATIGSNLLGDLWGAYISPYFEPSKLDTRYRTFEGRPVIIPAVGDLLRLLNSRAVNRNHVLRLLRAHGIDTGVLPNFPVGEPLGASSRAVWSYLTKFSGALPTADASYAMLVTGLSHQDINLQSLARMLCNFFGMLDPWLSDGQEVFARWWDYAIERSVTSLTPAEAAEAFWRGIIDNAEYLDYLKTILVKHNRWNSYVSRIINAWMPGPSDIIRFIVRDAFNDQIVQRYGYDEEYPAQYQQLFELTGPGYPLARLLTVLGGAKGDVNLGVDPAKSWAHYYWRAHWDLPSPTQAYEMLRRLRPNGAARLAQQLGVNANDIVTTLDDVRTLLKIADYPRYWRDRLIAISYHPLTRMDLRMILAEGIPDPVPVEERLQDLGYSAQDAEVVARLFRRRNFRQLQARGLIPRESEIIRYGAQGLIGVGETQQLIAALQLPPDQAAALQAAIDLKARIEDRKHLIRHVKTAFVKAIISEQQARQMLTQSGLDPGLIERHITRAKLERLSSRRRDTAAGIVWDWQRGLITTAQAIMDLDDIGFTHGTALRMLRRGYIKEVERRLKILQAYYRALEAEYRRILAERNRLLREAKRIAKEQQKSLEEAKREAERELEEARKLAKEQYEQRQKEAEEQAPEEPTEEDLPEEEE